MMDEEFTKSLRAISGAIKGDLMDYYILTPLRNKNGGDFVSFILDFTNAYHTEEWVGFNGHLQHLQKVIIEWVGLHGHL